MLSKDNYYKRNSGRGERSDNRKINKSTLYCDYCKSKWHTRDNFFKLHGYPDWYIGMGENKNKDGNKNSANRQKCQVGQEKLI